MNDKQVKRDHGTSYSLAQCAELLGLSSGQRYESDFQWSCLELPIQSRPGLLARMDTELRKLVDTEFLRRNS
jgi:hypothetical protein